MSEPSSVTDPPLRPPSGPFDAYAALDRFLAVMADRGLELYPEQEEAVLELFGGSNVVLNTPTGSGKSLVAAAAHYRALCAGEQSVYTCPIKALVNEKFLSMCRDFGPENVGMMTGDASVNPHAPILCCTAEILANIALARGPLADLRMVVMDEFHYYGDAERGHAWQTPLLALPQCRFLLMSATLGDTEFFEREMTRVTGAPSVTVKSDRRPVPLTFEYSETPLTEKVAQLIELDKAPIYLVHFTQRAASESAQGWMSLTLNSKTEKEALAEALKDEKFNSPYGKDMKRWLRHGVGVHHAGLLPKYRILVERLAQRGLLKIICGTDTLGVGINVPIRTVVFTQLWKYDGRKAAVLTVRDFRQVAGRAGRRGYDDEGLVVAQAPEHIIENKRAAEKAAAGSGKKKKVVKRSAPPGSVVWDEKTYAKLQTAPCEELSSKFTLSHGTLLLVLSRPGDGCRAVRDLVATCHETDHRKNQLRQRGWQLFRGLLERGIVEWIPPTDDGHKLRVNVELQEDFSLHNALSLYLLDTLPRLPRDDDDHALNVLTLCESIVEDPEIILRKQVDRLKTDAVSEMKADGVSYEERMEKLDAIEHPKPLREFLYETFNAFSANHPWVEQENVRPKSIAREMFERYDSFGDYVKRYGLQRSEGLLLRHLSQTWKVLSQTVPQDTKTEAIIDLEIYFRELIRGIDSSLLEEWERMQDPDYAAEEVADKPERPGFADITHDRKEFTRLVRFAVHGVLQDAMARDWEAAAERTERESRTIEDSFVRYVEARDWFRLDPEGRATKHTHIEEDGETWHVAQVLVDYEEHNDWELRVEVDLPASRDAGLVKMRWVGLEPIGA
ncbi:MAG: DEAD/DEAH box helicase [Synoicihabitans sp.]